MKKLSENPLVVMVGLISSCIAIYAFVTGINRISDMLRPSDNTISNQEVITQVQATDYIPGQPTLITIPSLTDIPTTPFPTKDPNTPFNSILDVGKPWRENDFELTLTNAKLTGTCQSNDLPPTIVIEVKFQLTNMSSYDLPIRYSMGASVSAVSNLGQNLEIEHYGSMTFAYCDYPSWDNNFESITTIIHPSETIDLYNTTNINFDYKTLLIKGDFLDPSLTEIIISVSEIANITNARWRIAVMH